MKLYQLPAAFDAISALASEDGELSPEAFKQLTALEIELERKIEGCCRVMRNYEARALAFKAEAERLAHHRAIAESNAKRLKDYVKATLEAIGVQKVETELFKVRIQANPISVQINDTVDVEKLPDAFKTVTVQPNRKAMADAAKGGEELPDGCVLVRGTHLRVS